MALAYEIKRRPFLRNPNIRVEMDDRVVVTVALSTRKGWIKEFVEEKSRWITRRLQENAKLRRLFPPRRYLEGERFSFLGRSYPLAIEVGRRKSAFLGEDGRLHVFLPSVLPSGSRAAATRARLVGWYRERTRALVREPLRRISKKLKLEPKRVRIHDSKTVWGSSTSKGGINFSCRLAMAPLEVLEYLVIHELCHQVHMNHSKAFWDLVESQCPGYRVHEKWLRETGRYLEI